MLWGVNLNSDHVCTTQSKTQCTTKLSIRSVNSLLRTRGRYVIAGDTPLIKFLPLSRAPAARFKIPREEEPRRSREYNHLDIFPRDAILYPVATHSRRP